MKHTLVILAFLFNCQFSFAQRPNLQIRALAGLNVFTINFQNDTITNGVSVGYTGGFGFRVTKNNIMGNLNFNFIRSGLPLNFTSLGEEDGKNNVKIYAFELPLTVGYKFVNNAFFKWHVNTGINTLLVTNVENNDVDLSVKNLINPQFGLRFGSGIDFAFFTFDFNYTYGLNRFVRNLNRTHNHLVQFNVGVIF